MLASAEYTEHEANLNSGDTLVIYSDGVTETGEFGPERLGATVAAHRTEPAESIIESVNQAVALHTGGAPASDDVTLIVVRRL